VTAPVFILPDLAHATVGDVVRLSADEGRHAVAAKRIAVGEAIDLVDGRGRRVSGVVAAVVDRQTVEVTVGVVIDEPVDELHVVAVQALAKGDRGELAVEQLTEIGVDEIVPWSALHSVVQWRGDRAAKSERRWLDSATAAAKQARRARFPVIAPLASTPAVCQRIRSAAMAVVLHEAASTPIDEIDVPTSGELLVVVGPEGGVAGDELDQFVDAGARIVRLGPTVLRTSSAGLAAIAVLLSATARWRTVEG
jgi:16S rRNA (uracil1498-N3)-methyltransferase